MHYNVDHTRKLENLEFLVKLYELNMTPKEIKKFKKIQKKYSYLNVSFQKSDFDVSVKHNNLIITKTSVELEHGKFTYYHSEIYFTEPPTEKECRQLELLAHWNFHYIFKYPTDSHFKNFDTYLDSISFNEKNSNCEKIFELDIDCLTRIFGTDANKIKRLADETATLDYGFKNIGLAHIFYVQELKNFRRYFYWEHRHYYGPRMAYSQSLPGNSNFDYIDAGRNFCDSIYFDSDIELTGDENFFVEYLSPNFGRGPGATRIDYKTYLKHKREYQLEKFRKESQEKQALIVKEKIQEAISTRKTVVINDVVFSSKGIEYAGQRLQSDVISSFALLERFLAYSGVNSLNFDSIYTFFFDALKQAIYDFSHRPRNINCFLGTLPVILGYKKTKIGSTQALIEGIRINLSEISPILEKATCFDEIEDYRQLVKNISKCSLRFHELLSNGIKFQVFDGYLRGILTGTLPLIRRKNRFFLCIGNKDYSIKNINRLLRIENLREYSSGISELISIFGDKKIIEIDNFDTIAEIILLGRTEYQKKLQQQQEFLDRTVRTLELENQTRTVNGYAKDGYIVKGKLRNYFVTLPSSETEKPEVYRENDNSYICIVDKTLGQSGIRSFVNRVYALKNDSVIAKTIDSLKEN